MIRAIVWAIIVGGSVLLGLRALGLPEWIGGPIAIVVGFAVGRLERRLERRREEFERALGREIGEGIDRVLAGADLCTSCGAPIDHDDPHLYCSRCAEGYPPDPDPDAVPGACSYPDHVWPSIESSFERRCLRCGMPGDI